MQNFVRNKEDFACEKCGAEVHGTGYTNHCPKCLWSKHVDIVPGDRKATCLGLMEPVSVTIKRDDYVILHRCTKCKHERPNKSSPEDDFEKILKLSVAKISDL